MDIPHQGKGIITSCKHHIKQMCAPRILMVLTPRDLSPDHLECASKTKKQRTYNYPWASPWFDPYLCLSVYKCRAAFYPFIRIQNGFSPLTSTAESNPAVNSYTSNTHVNKSAASAPIWKLIWFLPFSHQYDFYSISLLLKLLSFTLNVHFVTSKWVCSYIVCIYMLSCAHLCEHDVWFVR